MWCWRRTEKISWTDYVKNEEVLLRVNEQRNILHEIRKWKANWIGRILRRNNEKGRDGSDKRPGKDVRNYWMTLRIGEDTLI
jgi:hypothetical protein